MIESLIHKGETQVSFVNHRHGRPGEPEGLHAEKRAHA